MKITYNKYFFLEIFYLQANKSKESQLNDANENGVSEDGSSKKPTKKKKVSFKFGLETSDDAHIVKKEPNTTFDPPVSIIKKECLTRPIIAPSRLSFTTQTQFPNNANQIDKLNSLTFKSQRKENSEENETSNEEDQSDAEAENEERKRDSDECDDSDSNGESNHNKNEEGSMHNDDNGKGVAFQLPKRSAHSSRVIKPNKRFTDDSKSISNKNGFGKKKGTKLEIKSEPLEAIKKEGILQTSYNRKYFFFKFSPSFFYR